MFCGRVSTGGFSKTDEGVIAIHPLQCRPRVFLLTKTLLQEPDNMHHPIRDIHVLSLTVVEHDIVCRQNLQELEVEH